MTNDAKTLLYCIYGIYKQRCKTESRAESKCIDDDMLKERCNSVIHLEDIDDLLNELSDNGLVTCDVLGTVHLKNESISLMENLPKEEFLKLTDFISKFF